MDADKLADDLKLQEESGAWKSTRKQRKLEEQRIPSQKDVIFKLPPHIKNAIRLTGEFKTLEKHDRYMISGTGIPAIAGDIFKTYVSDYGYDIHVNRGFELPAGNRNTLVFICSYTGNDEETISSYKSALRMGYKIIGITGGGRLLDAFARNNTEHIALPKVHEPSSIIYFLIPMLKIFENSQLIKSQKEFIDLTIETLQKPELSEMGKQLYQKLEDKIPVIYVGPRFEAVAKYWKSQFNLNSRIPSFVSVLTDASIELNSFVRDMWDFYAVFLRDSEESKQIIKSMASAKKIIKNRGYGTTEINVMGSNPLARIFSALAIADYTSYYLNQYYKLDEDLRAKYLEDFGKV